MFKKIKYEIKEMIIVCLSGAIVFGSLSWFITEKLGINFISDIENIVYDRDSSPNINNSINKDTGDKLVELVDFKVGNENTCEDMKIGVKDYLYYWYKEDEKTIQKKIPLKNCEIHKDLENGQIPYMKIQGDEYQLYISSIDDLLK